jgi:hypothetical protein
MEVPEVLGRRMEPGAEFEIFTQMRRAGTAYQDSTIWVPNVCTEALPTAPSPTDDFQRSAGGRYRPAAAALHPAPLRRGSREPCRLNA